MLRMASILFILFYFIFYMIVLAKGQQKYVKKNKIKTSLVFAVLLFCVDLSNNTS